jgi:hypothetical protein
VATCDSVPDVIRRSYSMQEGLAHELLLVSSSRLREVGAGGGSRTLTGLLSPADFLTDHGFRRPDEFALHCPVCGLDYTFTISR